MSIPRTMVDHFVPEGSRITSVLLRTGAQLSPMREAGFRFINDAVAECRTQDREGRVTVWVFAVEDIATVGYRPAPGEAS